MSEEEKKIENGDVEIPTEEEVIELPPSEEVTAVTGYDSETIEVNVDSEADDAQPAGDEPEVAGDEPEAAGDEPEVEPVEVEPEPWPPFKSMPWVKKPEGQTVKERVPGFKNRVLKLYKRMKRGKRLTEEQFAKRLRLKDPRDIQAAGIAWHSLFDEGKIPTTEFYKPLS